MYFFDTHCIPGNYLHTQWTGALGHEPLEAPECHDVNKVLHFLVKWRQNPPPKSDSILVLDEEMEPVELGHDSDDDEG